MSETLATLLRVNLAATLAIAAVLVLRRPVRRLFGAQVAYGLWMLAPLVCGAMLAPPRIVTITEPAPVTEIVTLAGTTSAAAATASAFDPAPGLLGLWAAGVAGCALALARSELQFRRAARAGRAGPAAIGLLKPRIVLPADFEDRYGPRERQVILAHERTHIARGDPRINALVAAARCAAWFNPLVHLAAHYQRIDQELACDAAVVSAHPAARRTYAEAMLKTQLAARPLPLGCYWPAAAAHPLAERIALLGRARPGRRRRAAGAAIVAVLALGSAISAWTARPPQLRVAFASAPVAMQPVRPVQRLAITAATPRRESVPEPLPAATAAMATAEIPPAPLLDAAPADAPAPKLIPASDPMASEIRGAAERSHVEPGSAVRVLATMTDPDGRRLVTDLTAFGSQSVYRIGYVERDGSRYSLFTSVEQLGETLYVTASLGRRFAPGTSGTIPLASGQTGTIVFDNGQAVTVTATLRAETPEELEAGARAMRKGRLVRASFNPDPFRCGRLDAVC
jgi:beta-lactamase regulating signal transducer with metallopeptidase domain